MVNSCYAKFVEVDTAVAIEVNLLEDFIGINVLEIEKMHVMQVI